MSKWVEIRKGGNFIEIGKRFGISPVVARLLVNRGVAESEMADYLYATIDNMHDAHQMKDVDKSCEILESKLREHKKVRIIGDYDIDGVFSAYILEKTFREIDAYISEGGGKSDIDVVLPHRIYDGYGLSLGLVKAAYDDGVDTIVTCDNGIAAKQEIEYAKSLGMTVIVTDHHEIPYRMDGEKKVYEIPRADAVVNPHQTDCDYPFEGLCGAGVAYKLSQAMYERMGIKVGKEKFLEFAAFATIGDVMQLVGENRIIVKYGLGILQCTENPGLRSLIKATGLDGKKLSFYQVGFVLGPCINASGRIDSAMKALNLLEAETENEADKIALELSMLNESRKQMTNDGAKKACAILDNSEKIPKVIVVFLKECHESIAGIIAGKLREKYCHPAIVITDGKDGLKGSGRSIDNYNMYESLNQVKDMFSKFGGHALAAGFSIKVENESDKEKVVNELSDRLNEMADLSEADFEEKIEIDMALPFSCIDKTLMQQLELLEPCGTGNKKPLFAQRNVVMRNCRVLGKKRNVFKCVACDGSGASMEAVCFGNADEINRTVMQKDNMMMLYYPQYNDFDGDLTIQLSVKEIR